MEAYARRWGLFREPGPTAEIARLDAERDCQRIAHLLAVYEFPWDMPRALELALFHTYGSASVAALLDRTGEFRRRGQKRYDDTQLLIGEFLEKGWDSELGARAIARMNTLHGAYAIANEDFLFVLWTFIDFPLRWAEAFAWRPFSDHEARAWFCFWRGVGERMSIRDIPRDKASFDAFIADYEARRMIPNPASRRVADATVDIMRAWLPAPLRGVVQPVAGCLARPQLRRAFGYAEPSPVLSASVRAALAVRGRITRYVPLSRYPSTLAGLRTRSYGRGPTQIDALGAEVSGHGKDAPASPS